MKKTFTISVIAGYLLMMSALGIFAAVPGRVEKTLQENIQKQIDRHISCPSFITGTTGTNVVRAIIRIDEKGKINIEGINASDEHLKQYVVEQLESMTIKNIVSPEKFILLIRYVVS
jgi:hypothetical protein